MEELFLTYRTLLERVPTYFFRFLHDKIIWGSRLIAILGNRGVGKSTLMLQHIKMHEDVDKCLYVTADDFYFSTHRLYDLAKEFYLSGGKSLFIDETHKYKDWSQEIKNIYDKDVRIRLLGINLC